MDILYVVKNFPKLSESFVINEIYELERRGHNVAVFAQHQPDESIQHDELNELDIPVQYHSKLEYSGITDLLTPKVFSPCVLKRALYRAAAREHAIHLNCGRQIADFIDDLGGVDLIHSHFAIPDNYPAVYAGAYHNIPCTVTAHAYEIFNSPDEEFLNQFFGYVDEVVVPSKYNKEYLRTELQIEEPITVVPATNSVRKFPATQKTVPGRILTVGRLVEKKGYEYSIQAVKKLVDSGYDIEYHIVGNGSKEKELKKLVNELGLENYVTFLGNVSDQQLRDEYSEAEAFLLACVIAESGNRDAMPVVLKEAMSAETPCVSTTVSAIPELISNGHNGVLVPPKEADALAEEVASLLENEHKRQQLAQNGSETVKEKFDIEASVDTLINVFERCTARYR